MPQIPSAGGAGESPASPGVAAPEEPPAPLRPASAESGAEGSPGRRIRRLQAARTGEAAPREDHRGRGDRRPGETPADHRGQRRAAAVQPQRHRTIRSQYLKSPVGRSGRPRDTGDPDRGARCRLRPCRRRHAGRDVCLALFRRIPGRQADPAATGRAVQADLRRRLRGHEERRRLPLLPRRHHAERASGSISLPGD